jgi:cytochrome P450 / NADPH-cytochrome P450 reductase
MFYKEHFDEWEKIGAVKFYRAFSQASELTGGCKNVQDRVGAERETITTLFKMRVKSYICGIAGLGKCVADVDARIQIENCVKAREEQPCYRKGLE